MIGSCTFFLFMTFTLVPKACLVFQAKQILEKKVKRKRKLNAELNISSSILNSGSLTENQRDFFSGNLSVLLYFEIYVLFLPVPVLCSLWNVRDNKLHTSLRWRCKSFSCLKGDWKFVPPSSYNEKNFFWHVEYSFIFLFYINLKYANLTQNFFKQSGRSG